MSKELNRIAGEIACIDTERLRAALVNTRGSHCEVWQTGGALLHDGARVPFDFVVKKFREPCPRRKIRVYRREYAALKAALEDIVPDALFVATRVDGRDGLVVLAQTCTPWFNIAEPSNEEETVPLLSRLPLARRQLQVFLDAARAWRAEREPKVIDLYGLDNLVLDRAQQIRYLDSFGVFYYEDVLDLVEDPEDALRTMIDISLKRLDYLDYALDAARALAASRGE